MTISEHDRETAAVPPPEGGRPFGHLRLHRLIARGPASEIYLGSDGEGRSVAVKLLAEASAADPVAAARFEREAQVLAALDHPHIVTVYEHGSIEGRSYISMEYVSGGTLAAYLRAEGPLEPDAAATLAAQIATALDHAHHQGIIHRDVKPSNVLLTPEREVKLTDFGIAHSDESEEPVTLAGAALGTATYLSPEQALAEAVTDRSDTYSLGAVLFEMVTGRPPFVGDSPFAIAYQHVYEKVIPPRAMNPAIPAALEVIILQALAKDPALRYRSASELAADLQRFSAGGTVLAVPPRQDPGVPTLARRATVEPSRKAATPTPAKRPEPKRARPPAAPVVLPPPVRAAGGHHPVRALALAAIVAAATFGFVDARAHGYLGGAKKTTTPDVSGLTAARAVDRLHGLGFTVKTERSPAGAADVGRVLSQNPAPDSSLAHGAAVTLVVGEPRIVQLPAVTGEDIGPARTALERAGVVVRVRRVDPATPGQAGGLVLSESPGSGRKVVAGSPVVLEVVKANTPVPVPDLAGLSQAAAGALLQAKGLTVAATTTAVSSPTVPSGFVVGSSPTTATKIASGAPVTLIVSSGPPVVDNSIPVPALTGRTALQAAHLLKARGLAYRVVTVPTSEPLLNGTVERTSPRRGALVPRGSTVVLDVWSTSAGAPAGGTTPSTIGITPATPTS